MNRGRRHSRLMGDINVVPYIDVMLVLLVIFMITAPLLTQGIKVELPNAGAAPLDDDMLKETEPLILSIDSAGNYYLNVGDDEEQPIDGATVVTRVTAVLTRNQELPVLVNADQAVPYGRVVTGMVLLQRSGATKLGFLTDPLNPNADLP